jgi:hypothetical protein
VIALAIALAVVGLAAVLAAWSLGARWLAVTAARGKHEDVAALAARIDDEREQLGMINGEMQVRLAALEEKTADLEEQLRKARVARLGAR